MTGIIGVSASEMARFSQFSSCLANLDKPAGTVVQFETGIDIGINRRNIVRACLEGDHEWVWFVDDDMVFGPDHLTGLLAHSLPAVASLYINRKPPFYPVAYGARTTVDGNDMWKPVVLEGAPEEGLAEIVAAGTGGLLVRSDVLGAIPYDTWFLHDEGTEDLPFCQRIIDAGFKIYLDLAAVMGHISTYVARPVLTGKGWHASIGLTDESQLLLEMGK